MRGSSGGRSPIRGKDEDDVEDIGKLLEPRSSWCSACLLASCTPDVVAAAHAALGLDGAPMRRHTQPRQPPPWVRVGCHVHRPTRPWTARPSAAPGRATAAHAYSWGRRFPSTPPPLPMDPPSGIGVAPANRCSARPRAAGWSPRRDERKKTTLFQYNPS